MKLVLLKHQDHRRAFVLERSSGRYETGWNRDLTLTHPNGLGSEYKCGLWNRRRVLCALFADKNTILLRIGTLEIDIFDSRLSMVTTSSAPFVRTFEIREGKKTLLSCRYWKPVFLEDPDEDLLLLASGFARQDPVTREETRVRWVRSFSPTASSDS